LKIKVPGSWVWNPDPGSWSLDPGLNSFFEITCPDASRADSSFPDLSLFPYPDGLEVGEVAALGLVVGVADVIPHHGAFSTDIAGTGHVLLLKGFNPPVSRRFYIAGKDLDC